jgi:ubiquitin C-terminal hydrolase
MQALNRCEAFRDEIISMPFSDQGPRVRADPLCLEFVTFLSEMADVCGDTTIPINPDAFIRNVRNGFFAEGHQDAGEFCKLMLHKLSPDVPSSANPPSNGSDAVYKYFGMRTANTTECRCGHCSTRLDWSLELTLPLSSSSPLLPDNSVLGVDARGVRRTIQSLIANTIGPESQEHLTGEAKYACSHCNTRSDATRTIRVIDTCSVDQPGTAISSPKYVILQLNRFEFDRSTSRSVKNFTLVDVPLRVRIPTTAIRSPNGCIDHLTPDNFHVVPYDLIAVVVHCGSSVQAGHYYTLVSEGSRSTNNETSETVTWYCCDDSHVQHHCTSPSPQNPSAESYSLDTKFMDNNCTPYLLFYEKSRYNHIESQTEIPPREIHRV